MATLTNVEAEIMNILQKHFSIKETIDLSQLADECHVAQSTIVKLSKKLGYSGFVEMYYKMRHQYEMENENSFDEDLIVGNLEEIIHQLALKLKECERMKNIISETKNCELLGRYLSRKLNMFDILAPCTYDYMMAKPVRLKGGIAVFFLKNEIDLYTIEELLRITIQENYYIVVIADEKIQRIPKHVDMVIRIIETNFQTANFFEAKVIIFIEMLLCEYSKISMEDKE